LAKSNISSSYVLDFDRTYKIVIDSVQNQRQNIPETSPECRKFGVMKEQKN
jgi:hypothetical protein